MAKAREEKREGENKEMIRICGACYIEYDDDFRAKECPHKLWTKRSLVERIEALEKAIAEMQEKKDAATEQNG